MTDREYGIYIGFLWGLATGLSLAVVLIVATRWLS